MKAQGYPHKQPFNLKAGQTKPNKKRKAWYKLGSSNNRKQEKPA